jgi:hypothetical protein
MVQGSTEYLAQCGADDLQMRTINAYGAGALSRYNCHRESKRDTGQVVFELTIFGDGRFHSLTVTPTPADIVQKLGFISFLVLAHLALK